MSYNFFFLEKYHLKLRTSIYLGIAKYYTSLIARHCSEDHHRPQGIGTLINKIHPHNCTNQCHRFMQLTANFLNESDKCSFILAYKRAYYVPAAHSNLAIKYLSHFIYKVYELLRTSDFQQCFLVIRDSSNTFRVFKEAKTKTNINLRKYFCHESFFTNFGRGWGS